MELNEDAIREIIKTLDSKSLDFTLHFPEKSFTVNNMGISKVTTPVTKRTQRGGVYFSDVEIFRVKAQVADKEIIPFISKAMLGPNTEFADIQLITNTIIQGKKSNIIIHTNLTNSMENSSFVELSLTITSTEIN